MYSGIKGGYEVPSFMSDKQKQRIANDPIRALKYGNQLAGFSDDFNKSWLELIISWIFSQSECDPQFEISPDWLNFNHFFNQVKRVDKQVSRMNYVENNNLDRLEKRLKSRRQEDYSDDYFESEEAMMSIKVSL